MDDADFTKCLKKVFNGASGGRTGLTGDHMVPILHSAEGRAQLLRVVALIINGQLPEWMHPYFAGFRCIGLGKKVRPICIGEFILRLAS